MEKITAYKTHDGIVHKTEKAAENHCEQEISKLLSPIIERLTDISFSKAFRLRFGELILSNLEAFAKIKAYEDDKKLTENEDL